MTKRFAAVTPASGWHPKFTFSAATGVMVAGLILPGALIETKAIALAPSTAGKPS